MYFESNEVFVVWIVIKDLKKNIKTDKREWKLYSLLFLRVSKIIVLI